MPPTEAASKLCRCSPKGLGGLGPPKGVKKNLHNHFICATGTNIDAKILCLVIVNVNVSKYMMQKCQKMTDLWLSGVCSQLKQIVYTVIEL